MADVKISDLGELTSPAGEDLLVIVDDPSGTPVSKKVTATNLFGTVSIDADSNTVSNLEVDNFKASAIVIESEGISSNDNDTTIPTSASVKDYVDLQIATEDTIAELNDTTITSVGDNEILQYNNSSSVWENQTLSEAGIQGTLTNGIADTNNVVIDGSGSASGEYAKFTSSGIVGEEVADVKTDLSLNNVENTAISTWAGTSNITTLGTIATGVWNGTAITYANLNLSSSIVTGDITDGTIALGDLANATKTQALIIACSDETTALTTGTGKATFRMPYAFTLTEVRASVTTAPTGSAITVDVNDGGTTIMSTNKITIDATEKSSEDASTAPALTDTSLADDSEITIDIDAVGSTVAGAGLKVALIGYKT